MFNIISAKSFMRKERIKKAKNILFAKSSMCKYINKKLKDVDTSYHNEIRFNVDDFTFAPNTIDFMFLTHAHIDHSGRIPKLYNDGFKENIRNIIKAVILIIITIGLNFIQIK